jgi:hypothetical protein
MKEVHTAEQSFYITQEEKLGSGVQIFSKILFLNFNYSIGFIYTDCTTLSKKYPALFFPAVNNGERVGKLSAVVEGTFMRMRDFLLPLNTAGCVCRCQTVKWCNTCCR